MPNPRFETAQGTVDGVNRDFSVSEDYTANTLVVFRNGQLLERSMDNGWVELGGNDFRMNIAPLPADILQAFYMDTLPSEGGYIEVEVEKIHAVVSESDSITAELDLREEITAMVQEEDSEELIGTIEPIDNVSSAVQEESELTVTMQECY